MPGGRLPDHREGAARAGDATEDDARGDGAFAGIASARCPRGADRSTPLIGIVGEIFCRLHCFSNEDLVRRLEEYEAEAWISDITEWVWYTISEQFRKLHLVGRQYSLDAFKAWIRKRVQKPRRARAAGAVPGRFVGYEEPPVEEVLEAARPYLPADGALGEMVLNVGKAICLAKKARTDYRYQPVTCMNGIVCEAVYPRFAGPGGIPDSQFLIRWTQNDLDRIWACTWSWHGITRSGSGGSGCGRRRLGRRGMSSFRTWA